MNRTIKNYPIAYVSIYKALTQPCPFAAFNEQVQGVLAAMIELDIFAIDKNGDVSRNPKFYCMDFYSQLALSQMNNNRLA